MIGAVICVVALGSAGHGVAQTAPAAKLVAATAPGNAGAVAGRIHSRADLHRARRQHADRRDAVANPGAG